MPNGDRNLVVEDTLAGRERGTRLGDWLTREQARELLRQSSLLKLNPIMHSPCKVISLLATLHTWVHEKSRRNMNSLPHGSSQILVMRCRELSGSPTLGIVAGFDAIYAPHMKAVTRVEIELLIDEQILDESLEVLEALLDGIAGYGLISCAHIYIESEPSVSPDLWGPMLTQTVQ